MEGLPAEKVFCIGFNKTGTTSLNRFMELNGYRCGDQAEGELLIRAYANDDWKPILQYCNSANFFQDIPFSGSRMAGILKSAFPEAKFILTIRKNADVWYQSLKSFHEKVFGHDGHLPTMADLQAATYRYPGFAWEAHRALYASPESEPYHEAILKKCYTNHILNVRRLFGNSPNLLEMDISEDKSEAKLYSFLGIQNSQITMPWLNKISEYTK